MNKKSSFLLSWTENPDSSLYNTTFEIFSGGEYKLQCGFFIKNNILDKFNNISLLDITKDWHPVFTNEWNFYIRNKKDYSKLFLIPELVGFDSGTIDSFELVDTELINQYLIYLNNKLK